MGSAEALGGFFQDHLSDAVQIFEHVPIPESEHSPPFFPQIGGALLVISCRIQMLATVELQVGDSITACTTFSIAPNDPFKCESDEHWKFHDDDDE